jgi:hypothetical protein
MRKKNQIISGVKERLEWLRISHKSQMGAEMARAEMARKLVPAIKELGKDEIRILFSWGGNLTLDNDRPETHDKSWEIADKIYDQFITSGLDIQVEKKFNAYRSEPAWDWWVRVRMNKNDRDSKTLTLIVPNAEADLDCVPMRESSVNSYWLCKKV